MNKKTFTKLLKEIIVEEKRVEKLENAINQMSPDSHGVIFNFTELSLMILAEAVDDNTEWISYWFWELEKGKKAKNGTVKDSDGREIPIKTISNLYDIIKNKKY